MEDVLDLYAQPYQAEQPLVCFDERPCVLHSDLHPLIPAQPGQVARYDYEYQRQGSCNLFMLFQPGAGWRHAKVTDQRTKADFAQCMRELVDVHFPQAEKIRVVLDNLNTPTPASLYTAFPPAEARRILNKLEFHFTPKHASWLNMVEIELSVLVHQCLKRRIPDQRGEGMKAGQSRGIGGQAGAESAEGAGRVAAQVTACHISSHLAFRARTAA